MCTRAFHHHIAALLASYVRIDGFLGYACVPLQLFPTSAKSAPSSRRCCLQTAMRCRPFREKMQGFYLITYLRCLVSMELLSHEDDYLPFVLGTTVSDRAVAEREVQLGTFHLQFQISVYAHAFSKSSATVKMTLHILRPSMTSAGLRHCEDVLRHAGGSRGRGRRPAAADSDGQGLGLPHPHRVSGRLTRGQGASVAPACILSGIMMRLLLR